MFSFSFRLAQLFVVAIIHLYVFPASEWSPAPRPGSSPGLTSADDDENVDAPLGCVGGLVEMIRLDDVASDLATAAQGVAPAEAEAARLKGLAGGPGSDGPNPMGMVLVDYTYWGEAHVKLGAEEGEEVHVARGAGAGSPPPPPSPSAPPALPASPPPPSPRPPPLTHAAAALHPPQPPASSSIALAPLGLPVTGMTPTTASGGWGWAAVIPGEPEAAGRPSLSARKSSYLAHPRHPSAAFIPTSPPGREAGPSWAVDAWAVPMPPPVAASQGQAQPVPVPPQARPRGWGIIAPAPASSGWRAAEQPARTVRPQLEGTTTTQQRPGVVSGVGLPNLARAEAVSARLWGGVAGAVPPLQQLAAAPAAVPRLQQQPGGVAGTASAAHDKAAGAKGGPTAAPAGGFVM